MKHSGGPLDNQTWQTNDWSQQKLPKFGFHTRTIALWPMEQSSILFAKFQWPARIFTCCYCAWPWNWLITENEQWTICLPCALTPTPTVPICSLLINRADEQQSLEMVLCMGWTLPRLCCHFGLNSTELLWASYAILLLLSHCNTVSNLGGCLRMVSVLFEMKIER